MDNFIMNTSTMLRQDFKEKNYYESVNRAYCEVYILWTTLEIDFT